MSAYVRTCRGWWPSLVEAICDDCGWVGPTRDLNKPTGGALAKLDAREHDCRGTLTRAREDADARGDS